MAKQKTISMNPPKSEESLVKELKINQRLIAEIANALKSYLQKNSNSKS